MSRKPNLFIVGAPKAGTTSLHEYLKQISGIFMSEIKEPNFFSYKTIPNDHHPVLTVIRDKTKYLELFKNAKNEKYLGESSTTYLADREAYKLIHSFSTDSKIIISLRDPIERGYSQYLAHIKKRSDLSFHEQIEKELENKIDNGDKNPVLRYSMYYEDVKKYFDLFGRTRIKIIIFEEMVKNPKKTLNEILNFLEMDGRLEHINDKAFNKTVQFEPRGKLGKLLTENKISSKIARKILPESYRTIINENIIMKKKEKPKMHEVDVDFLKKFFQDDVTKLKNLLKRQLPWTYF